MINSKKNIPLFFFIFSLLICNVATAKTKLIGTKKYWKAYVTEVKKIKHVL